LIFGCQLGGSLAKVDRARFNVCCNILNRRVRKLSYTFLWVHLVKVHSDTSLQNVSNVIEVICPVPISKDDGIVFNSLHDLLSFKSARIRICIEIAFPVFQPRRDALPPIKSNIAYGRIKSQEKHNDAQSNGTECGNL